jgi:hypothetical protein
VIDDKSQNPKDFTGLKRKGLSPARKRNQLGWEYSSETFVFRERVLPDWLLDSLRGWPLDLLRGWGKG